MKGLFIHDHVFYRYNNKHYSSGGLPAIVWERYLDYVDKLTVMSRGSALETESNGLVLSEKDNVIFNLFYNVKGGIDYYKYQNEIKKKLKEQIEVHDLIIIRVPSTIGAFAAKICNNINKPYLTEVVGCAWDSNWNYGSLPIKLQAPFSFLKMRKIVAKSIASIYVTQFFLQSRYPNKGITSFASNVQILKNDSIVLENHMDLLNKSKTVYKIGIIGNLSIKFKGFDVALKSLDLLKKDGVSFMFYLVGGGNQSYVKGLIKKFNLEDCTEIIGRLESGIEVFNFLDSLDLYIHPSKQEGLPRAVIEAMSRACPILASTVAGIPELIKEDYLHSPGDYKSLYKQLKNIIGNKELLSKMAKTNFEKSKEYNINILSKRRFDFFRQTIQEIENNGKK